MPSPASRQPSGAASTRVTRTPSRRGTGPVAASATTADAAGGPTTTTSSPPPSSDQASLGLRARRGIDPWGLVSCAVASAQASAPPGRARPYRRLWRQLTRDVGAQNDGRRTLFNPLRTGYLFRTATWSPRQASLGRG